jgi:hypothetical protein
MQEIPPSLIQDGNGLPLRAERIEAIEMDLPGNDRRQ